MKKIISALIALSMLTVIGITVNAASAQSNKLTNITEKREVWTPFTVNEGSGAEKLVDGKFLSSTDKWCSNAYLTDQNNREPVFVMIKLDSKTTADGFRLINSSISEGEFSSIRGFKIYTTNDDSMWKKATNQDLETSKFTLVYDSKVAQPELPVHKNSKYDTQGYFDFVMWPMPQGVTYDKEGRSHYGIAKEMAKDIDSIKTYEKFQKSFDAKYVVFQVSDNMDANPRVPEFQVFKAAGTTNSSSSSKPAGNTSSTKPTSSANVSSASSNTSSLVASEEISSTESSEVGLVSSEAESTVESVETSTETSTPGDGKNNNLMTIIIIIAVVVVLGGGGAAYYFLVMKK